MADTPLKVVRARKIIRGKAGTSSTELKGEFDLKVSLYKDGLFNNKRKVVVTDGSGNKVQGKEPLEYSTNGRYSDYTDIDYIRDYLDTQAKLQDGSATTTINGKEFPIYQILQDPWEQGTPLIRDFGYDPYYFNNGVKVEIFWFLKETKKFGTQSIERYENNYYPEGGVEWCNPRGFSISDLEKDEIIRETKEIKKIDIEKTIKLTMPNGSEYGVGYIPESERKLRAGRQYDDKGIVKYNELKRLQDFKTESDTNGREYFEGNYSDWNLLNFVKELYCFQLQRNKFIASQYDYDLELCKPDYDNCKLIEFKDPISGTPIEEPKAGKTEEKSIQPTDGSKTNASGTKIKLNIKIPDDIRAMANKDLPAIQVFVGDIPVDVNPNLYRDNDEISEEEALSEEYIEFNYQEPDRNAKDEIADPNDTDRGSPDAEIKATSNSSSTTTDSSTTTTTTVKPTVKSTDPPTVKEALKEATTSTGPGPGGKCARFTFNHANNFIRILLGKDPQGSSNAAGGNANQEGYHKALEKIGYKREDQGTLSKKEMISRLNNKSNWNIGDVIAYWGISSEESEKGGVKYGHTQIFTDGSHGTPHLWTSDDVGNFKCNFVYGKYSTDEWRFIIFKSPTTTEDGKKKMGLA